MFGSSASKKRSRADEDDTLHAFSSPLEKRSRPITNPPGNDVPSPWLHRYHDSVIFTQDSSPPSSRPREPPKYDSEDDQSSSEISEPGSPQDISMSSGDEADAIDSSSNHMHDDPSATFSQSPEDSVRRSTTDSVGEQTTIRPNHWGVLHTSPKTQRVATPIIPLRTKSQNGVKTHIRQRHPLEISPIPTSLGTSTRTSATATTTTTTQHLSVPSPILESADYPTPPCAAEAAGSQLSQLSVSDVEMLDEGLPVIAIDRVRAREISPSAHVNLLMGTGEGGGGGIVVRRQRQRSGALNGRGERLGANPPGMVGAAAGGNGGGFSGGGGGAAAPGGRRGFSIGYRPDCEKCRDKVPGHMNHWGV